MILYNMRNRGPYEYDKFVLNVLQIYNAITLNELHELDSNEEYQDSLKVIQKQIDNIFINVIGTSKSLGTAEKIYLQSLKLKEV